MDALVAQHKSNTKLQLSTAMLSFKFLRRAIPRKSASLCSTSTVSLEGYGKHLFKGAVAAPYLEKQGLPSNTLEGISWTTDGNADKVKLKAISFVVKST